jgi:hypothetical protein
MCSWILLPAIDDRAEGDCGAPVDDNSRYCAAHDQEMRAFIASDAERSNLRNDSGFSA